MARTVSGSTVIAADAGAVFDVLADPAQHRLIDGSGTVKGSTSGPDRLSLGTSFGMRMRLGAPYLISNKVVEYEEGRLIAWRHFGRHIWRYELALATGASGLPQTTVTETFDYRPSPIGRLLELLHVPEAHQRNIGRTLANLKELVESRRADS